MVGKWQDSRVIPVVNAFLISKHAGNIRKTYQDIADELGSVFPEYTFTGEAVRGYWKDSLRDTIKNQATDGRVTATDKPRGIKDWEFKHDSIEIVSLFDLHGLDTHTHYKILEDKVDYITDTSNAYAIVGGDLINFATTNSKSSTYESDSPSKEIKQLAEELSPIKDKILGAVGGNHGKDRGLRGDGVDPEEAIFARMGIPEIYFGNVGVLNLKLPDVNYYVVFSHGARGGGARRRAGQLVSLEDLQGVYPNADLYMTGHTHLFGHYVIASREIDKVANTVCIRYQHCVSAGSAFGYEGSYAEAKLYAPHPVGLAHIHLPNKLGKHGEKVIDVVFRS